MKELSELIKEYNDVTNKLEKNIRTYTYLYEFIISFIIVFNVCYGSIGVVNGLISYWGTYSFSKIYFKSRNIC